MPCPPPFALTQKATKLETLRDEGAVRAERADELEKRIVDAARFDADEDGKPLSFQQLANRFGYSKRGIQKLLARHGVSRTPASKARNELRAGPGAAVGVTLDVTERFSRGDVERVLERRGGSIHGSFDEL
jgi:hypothetical protein